MIDPQSVFLKQRVGEDDEFPHDGGEGEFALFATIDQALVEGAEVGIVAGGRERGPIEGAARAGAAAFDMALACRLAAVVGERGDTSEGGDGMTVERAELGEIEAHGGRVLAVTALGESVRAAQAKAYALVDRIDWPEGFCRRDIGWRAIAREGGQ